MPSLRRSALARALAAGAVLAIGTMPARAQSPTPAPLGHSYAAGSEAESYLRSLQALGVVPVHPWSLRPFSPVELDRLAAADSTHPWMARYRLAPAASAGPVVSLLPARLDTRYNSAFPYGSNDGAVWAGRGLTAVARAGVRLRWGPLTAAVAPVAFWTQNQPFPLLDNDQTGRRAFADGLYHDAVDRPQRFGASSYARVDAGDSYVRLDAFGASVGFSNAHEWWGPAQTFPFLLGTNAPGFPHLFAGTSKPANLWLVRAHARLLWGRLEQSDYFEPQGVTRPGRFVTGLIVAVQPRGLENLELGAARFIHAPWPDGAIPGSFYTWAFEGIFKRSLPTVSSPIPTDDRSEYGENQLASIFARLVIPGTGFELYSEFGREDHPWDRRYAVLNPDEQSSLTLGLRKTWRRSEGRMAVLRAESIDFQESGVSRVRSGRVFYIHRSGTNQGHTQQGQLLGADVGVGSAAGGVLGVDLLDGAGRWSGEWRRVIRQESTAPEPTERAALHLMDVQHALTFERHRFVGPYELTVGLTGVYNFNRDFARDVRGISVHLSVGRWR